ncbi:MAG: hypothetical protein ACLR56_12280 [Oscillospiraceae bacterium]
MVHLTKKIGMIYVFLICRFSIPVRKRIDGTFIADLVCKYFHLRAKRAGKHKKRQADGIAPQNARVKFGRPDISAPYDLPIL